MTSNYDKITEFCSLFQLICEIENFRTVNARIVKSHIQIVIKIVDPFFFFFFFFFCFFFSIGVVPLFCVMYRNLVCEKSHNVFELEPSCLVYWFGLRSRSPE